MGYHIIALLAVLPWLFSWTGVVVAVLGFPLYGLLGITLCYHRIFTHQGLTVPKWLEHIFALLGVCCLQDTPARWVAVHRLHHRHSDCQDDPHTPLVNFFWAHVGWVLVKHREHSRLTFFEQYARDILRDPFYLALERNFAWLWIYWLHAAIYFTAGLIGGRLWSGTWRASPVRREPAGVACFSGRCSSGTPLGCQFRHARPGLPQLSAPDDSRNQWLVACRLWRRLAQQSSRRPAGGRLTATAGGNTT